MPRHLTVLSDSLQIAKAQKEIIRANWGNYVDINHYLKGLLNCVNFSKYSA